MMRSVKGMCFALLLSLSQSRALDKVYVGKLQNSTAFIAMVGKGDKLIAYVCDGAAMYEWYTGKNKLGQFQQTPSSPQTSVLHASITNDAVSGYIKFNDSRLFFFRANPVPTGGTSGLYAFKETDYWGGWIVNSKGEQRGSFIGGGSIRPTRAARISVRGQLLKPVKQPKIGLVQPFKITPAWVEQNIKDK